MSFILPLLATIVLFYAARLLTPQEDWLFDKRSVQEFSNVLTSVAAFLSVLVWLAFWLSR